MFLLTTEKRDGVVVVAIDGALSPDGAEQLVDRLQRVGTGYPLVVDLSHLDHPSGPMTAEFLWRLESAIGAEGLTLVHEDLDERRRLRARTTIPVLPSTCEALRGHAFTALHLRAARHAHPAGTSLQ